MRPTAGRQAVQPSLASRLQLPPRSELIPLAAIVGLPNVGKSTLFNVLTRANAITSPVPGTTRDWLEGELKTDGNMIHLADTCGWGLQSELGTLMNASLAEVLSHSALAIMVVSARETVRDEEISLIQLLRRRRVATLLVCNKCDRVEDDTAAWEYTHLGLGMPLPVSALKHRNVGELRQRLVAQLSTQHAETACSSLSPAGGERGKKIRCVLLGQPNVGKSSLFNATLKRSRSLVHERPFTTRDPVHATATLNGQAWDLVDTAGVTRRKRHMHGDDTINRDAQSRSLRLLDGADVVVLLLDVTYPLVRQDLRLAQVASQRGASLVCALNKCDLLPPGTLNTLRSEATRYLQARFTQLGRLPILICSAVTGLGLQALQATIIELVKLRNVQVPTEVLVDVAYSWPTTGKPWRIRQTGIAPPAFFVLPPDGVKLGPRFVINRLRDAFGLHGVPIFIRWS